ncbi:hypothetical protein LCGC14_1857790 [marine sediment metagenome]|uniref:Replication protein n=1 Tax=marine sediment metagenome TaxID=412755 RepID=A0A0F9G8C7_9ZZZZ
MHNQTNLQQDPEHPIELHPLDHEVLELTGELPNLPLLVNPQILAKLRDPPSSVHTIETSGRNSTGAEQRPVAGQVGSDLPDPEDHQDYTYRGYLLKPRIDHYVRAREIYAKVDGSFGGKFSSRLGACRKFAWFVQSSVTNKLRVQSSRCKLRWCPICRDVSRMIVTKSVDNWLQVQKYPKMITLTLQHSDDPLKLQIKRIYDCFRKLRRRAYFQRLITGGVWFFQLKFNLTTGQWHPHIHCLVAGKFLPHTRLRNLWHEITGDSFVVDIRPVKDLDGCSNEVARYATSPADLTAVNLELALDIYYATKGRRICGSWGSARAIVLKPTPLEDTGEWTKVADFFFINIQKHHVPAVKHFWKCFKQGKPYDGPQLQKLTDVYKEELYAFESTGKEIISIRQFLSIVTAGRDHGWKGFYDTVQHGTF